MPETKPCSCGKKMLLVDTGVCYPSYPAQYPQEWHCGCGRREAAGIRMESTADERFMELWEKANEGS